MKIKLDENLPVSAAARLAALGFDVDTVLDEHLEGESDDAVWAAAQREQRLLVTQDLDFSDARRFAPGAHAGILIVRLPDSEQWRAADHLVAWFSDVDAQTWGACLVVATPNKVDGAGSRTSATQHAAYRRGRDWPPLQRWSSWLLRHGNGDDSRQARGDHRRGDGRPAEELVRILAALNLHHSGSFAAC